MYIFHSPVNTSKHRHSQQDTYKAAHTTDEFIHTKKEEKNFVIQINKWEHVPISVERLYVLAMHASFLCGSWHERNSISTWISFRFTYLNGRMELSNFFLFKDIDVPLCCVSLCCSVKSVCVKEDKVFPMAKNVNVEYFIFFFFLTCENSNSIRFVAQI